MGQGLISPAGSGLPSAFQSIPFSTTYTPGAHQEGLMYYDPDEGTVSIMTDIDGVSLQVGQEGYKNVLNDSGAQIDNGELVIITGADFGLPTIGLCDASDVATGIGIGLATHNIANDDGSGTVGKGKVTDRGLVRDVNTAAFGVGDTLWADPTTPGGLTNVKPVIAVTDTAILVKVGEVLISHATEGVIEVGIIIPAYTYVNESILFSVYEEQPSKNFNHQIHGAFVQALNGGAVSNGSPQAVTSGLSKLLIVVNAGADVNGTLTVTGTAVDRNSQTRTPGATEDITIDTLTTDNSTTDAQGNTIHGFENAYVTSSWYLGSITFSTTDLNLSDIDVYNVGFEQVNDAPVLTLTTVDTTLMTNNASAWFYEYFYILEVNGSKKCTITNPVSLALPVGDTVADRAYRLREGSIDVDIDGTTDGFWIEAFFGPNAQQYLENVNIKAWFQTRLPLR